MEQRDKKTLFIVNKFAGVGYKKDLEDQLIHYCEHHNVNYSIEFTSGPGHAIELARRATTSGYGIVVAVGGDGTLNEIGQGLLHAGIPMGIIPRGSGNGLARHLGISLKITEALEQLFSSKIISMDAFTVNGKLSLNVSGIGFDGHVTNLFGVSSGRGFFGYASITVMEFLRFNEFEIAITMNGKTIIRNAFIVAIANSSQYGNNARIAPAASVCDGRLHLTVVKKIPPYRFDFLVSFFNGNLGKSPFCEIIEASSMVLKVGRPMAFHIDGEPCGLNDTFNIELIPAALQVMIPEIQKNY